MENEDRRTLRLEIPGCAFTKLVADPTWTITNWSGGWSIFPGSVVLFWTGTIDLSGYAREMKTFYPSAAFTQKGPITTESGNGGTLLYTIVSTTPLVPLEVVTNLTGAGGQGFTSFSTASGNQDWDTVLFAETDVLVTNSNITPNPDGVLQTLSSEQSGSLSPTATDTLYVMKLYFPLVSNQTTIMIPPSRVIIPGKFGTEPDVEYMMRLKRSTELSQQV